MTRFFIVVLFGLLLIAKCYAQDATKETAVSIQTAQTRYSRTVVSLYELRQARLVRQSWDTSCGAAALSTLLTYHLGIQASEYAVATMILRNSDPNRVRQRGGFSLLDLKRLVESIGLAGEGFGSMSLADLENNAAPAIVPIRSHDLDHFVVFRSRIGDRVLLGDPAFGNLTVRVGEFESLWRSRIAFYVHRKSEGAMQTKQWLANEAELAIPDLSEVGRMLRGAGPAPAMRQLPLVARQPKP